MSEIIVALTFDGGPDGVKVGTDASRRYNTTERVLAELLAPRVAGVSDIKAAFFVQTHVPMRMAAADGSLGSSSTNRTHGQELVSRIVATGHIVAPLSGSKKDFHRHDEQQSTGELKPNLIRAVAELEKLLPSGGRVEFVRSPFGLYDSASDATYSTSPLALMHVYWDGQPTTVPIGDLSPGIPVGTKESPSDMLVLLRAIAGEARGEMRRRILENQKNKLPPPEPKSIVIRLHDVSAVTAAHLHDIIAVMLDSDPEERKPAVPLRFCATTDEVKSALRAVKPLDLTRTNFGLPDLASEPYDLRPRLARTYADSEEETLQIWDLIFTEFWVNHLYLDHLGKLTAGVGSLIDAAKLETLPLKKGTELATKEEKETARDALRKQLSKLPAAVKPRLRKCRALTGLDLDDTATLALLRADRKAHVKELDDLVTRLTNRPLSAYPLPVRIALADMMFNIGGRKLSQFGKMFAAIRRSDWRTAEHECRRNQNQENEPGKLGIKKRNDATAALFRAVSRLETVQPLALGAPLVTRITHATDGTPAVQPLSVVFTLEKGWQLDGALRWSLRIVSEALERKDESTPIAGSSMTPAFTVNLSEIRGGRLLLEAVGKVKRADGASTDVTAAPSGIVDVANPTQAAVRTALESSEPIAPLPAIAIKAIAYDATTLGEKTPESTAYRPFTASGLPIEPARQASGRRSGFYGLMRLPAASAPAEDPWNWKRQVAAALARLTLALARATADSATLPKQEALTDPQLLQQAVHYYGQLDLTIASTSLTQYWRREPGAKGWVQIDAGLSKYADRIVGIIAAVTAGKTPRGWNA